MDSQRIEFDEKGIKVYTDNGLIKDNGKTTHTTISGEFAMSAKDVVKLLAHFTESTFAKKLHHLLIPEWSVITSNEEVKAFIEKAISEATQDVRYMEEENDKFKKEIKRLRELIEDHNRGCIGLFHKKIKL